MKIWIGLVGIVAIGAAAWYFATAGSKSPHDGHVSDGGVLAAVIVPELSGLAAEGETVFNANCVACHGTNAAGKEGAGPPLVHKIYEPSHHADITFVLAAKQGVRQHHWPFGNMPAQPQVSEDEVSAVIAYVRTLQRANGIE